MNDTSLAVVIPMTPAHTTATQLRTNIGQAGQKGKVRIVRIRRRCSHAMTRVLGSRSWVRSQVLLRDAQRHRQTQLLWFDRQVSFNRDDLLEHRAHRAVAILAYSPP